MEGRDGGKEMIFLGGVKKTRTLNRHVVGKQTARRKVRFLHEAG